MRISKRFFGFLTPVFGVLGVQALCITAAPTISTAQTISLGCGTMNGSKATEGFVGVPYSASFAVSGGTSPLHFDIIPGLPPVLLFDATAGVVSGTPSSPGTYSFTAMVTDASGATASASCAIQIAQAPHTSPSGGGNTTGGGGNTTGGGNGKKK